MEPTHPSHSSSSDSPLDMVLKTPFLRVPLMLVIAAGAVCAIAGGFYTTYLVVTWIGN